jgi:hypothetical protein
VRRDVADDQHPLAGPAQRQVVKEPADPGHRLAPALASRVGSVEVVGPAAVHIGRRGAALPPVVALAQPPVGQHRDVAATERDRGGLRCPGQIRAEHRGQPVAPAASPEFGGLGLAPFGQRAGPPAGCDAALVVLRGGVLLEHDLD